jgi:uncharacterized protein YndB with AHSA1/START domain
MAKTIEQRVTFSVPPERLYRLYLNRREHETACGGWGKAAIVGRVGGRMAMAPHISGKFLHLVPGRMIVQTWRGSNWKRSDTDSILTLTFERVAQGTRLVMVHANVPEANARSIASATSGWHGHYWRPWKGYLRKQRARRAS